MVIKLIYYDMNLLSYNTNRLDPASFPPLYATSIKKAYELVKNYDVMVALDKFIDYVGEGLYMELGVYDKSSHYFPRPDHQYYPQTGKEVYIKLADCATCYAAGDIYLTRYFKLPQIFEDVFEPSDFDLSVKWTKRQQFRDLENILMERYSLPETMKGVITWIVLVEACFKKYHDRWIEQYDSNELKISNIDLENLTITGGIKTAAGKNRIIPIHSKIVEIVKKHYLASKGGYLFEYKNAQTPLSTFTRYWDNIMQLLEMKHTPHECRHTFRSRLDSAGANKVCIDRLMGHKSVGTGERVYTHKNIEELRLNIELITN